MSNLRYFLLTSIFVIVAFSVVTYTSCSVDKCKDVACLNGGGCLDGVCQCPSGYTGSVCQTPPTTVVTDPCANVVCQNGGTCSGGNCTCATGFEGTHCETAITAKYIGNYSVTEQCSLSGSVGPYTTTITQSTVNTLGIILNNFGDYTNPINANGTVSGNTLTIPSVTSGGITISNGTGTYSSGVINITYTASGGVNSETCTAVWTKQ